MIAVVSEARFGVRQGLDWLSLVAIAAMLAIIFINLWPVRE
jgi:hypothetical protein